MTPLPVGYCVILLFFAGLPWATRVNADLKTDRGATRRTGMALGIVHLAGLILPLLAKLTGAGPRMPAVACWFGVVLMLASLGLQQWAQRSLGACFTLALQSSADQPLCRSGPYAWIRHPAYLAQIALWIGLSLASGSLAAAALMAVAASAGYAYRIVEEERVMRTQLGERYSSYARGTTRLIPFLW